MQKSGEKFVASFTHYNIPYMKKNQKRENQP